MNAPNRVKLPSGREKIAAMSSSSDVAMHGGHFIGGQISRERDSTLRGHDPSRGEPLEPVFFEATEGEVDRACRLADAAFAPFAALAPKARAGFLREIGQEIVALGETLLNRAHQETGLPLARLQGERGRTVSQLEMFAVLIEEGSWVDARIDRAKPDRTPLPRPDLRRMRVPLGPVVVFGASNFPLAFSVAGGDTASALAAGCPVVVKAHPAHPGVCELVGDAIARAAKKTGMPEGTFSMLHGAGTAVGQALATHPLVKAIAFTGSFAGGRALFDAASRRPEPIPVYAEMGSANPVFILPDALAMRGEAIAKGLAASVTQGAGQFCTNPGLTLMQSSPAADAFIEHAAAILGSAPAGTLVHSGIKVAYDRELDKVAGLEGVSVRARSEAKGPCAETEARPALLLTDGASYARHPRLAEEIYGPVTVAVVCEGAAELIDVARSLKGHLTATIHATEKDLAEFQELVSVLRQKAGRLVFNGFPTGVEVCPAMHHGGPYPATTAAAATSVGTSAIERFVRPVCFQDFPQSSLPEELQDKNPRGIWRLVDGALTRDQLD
jgi:alpha-ketoglutaric semialdehyde dehydrogenase